MSATFRWPHADASWHGVSFDAVFYLMARFGEQGKGIVALQALRKTADPKEAQEILGDALPPLLAATLTPTEFGLIRQKLNGLPDQPCVRDLRSTIGLWCFAARFSFYTPRNLSIAAYSVPRNLACWWASRGIFHVRLLH